MTIKHILCLSVLASLGAYAAEVKTAKVLKVTHHDPFGFRGEASEEVQILNVTLSVQNICAALKAKFSASDVYIYSSDKPNMPLAHNRDEMGKSVAECTQIANENEGIVLAAEVRWHTLVKYDERPSLISGDLLPAKS
jgi:hypothetical protein